MHSFNSHIIDIEGTRAAERALYGPNDRARYYDMYGDIPIADVLAEARPAEVVRLVPNRKYQFRDVMPPPPAAPAPAPRPVLKPLPADDIEAVLRSAPQICATCKLLSDEPPRSCTSPRGHHFITDYPAMAAKVRAMRG